MNEDGPFGKIDKPTIGVDECPLEDADEIPADRYDLASPTISIRRQPKAIMNKDKNETHPYDSDGDDDDEKSAGLEWLRKNDPDHKW